MSEVAIFRYEPQVPPPLDLPPYAYVRVGGDETCYVGRLNEDGSGYRFDGETVTVMPDLWEGDQA